MNRGTPLCLASIVSIVGSAIIYHPSGISAQDSGSMNIEPQIVCNGKKLKAFRTPQNQLLYAAVVAFLVNDPGNCPSTDSKIILYTTINGSVLQLGNVYHGISKVGNADHYTYLIQDGNGGTIQQVARAVNKTLEKK